MNETEVQIRRNIHAVEGLRPQMEELKRVVLEYIASVQNAMLKRRTEYQLRLSQLRSAEVQLKSEIEMSNTLRSRLLEELSEEMRHRDQSSVKLEEMKIQKAALEKERDQFDKNLAEIELQISSKIKQINAQKDRMKNQTAMVNERLFQFEQLLGLRIEHAYLEQDVGSREDDAGDAGDRHEAIVFYFKNVDPHDFAREVSFTFDPATVSVVDSAPLLSREDFSQATKLFLETKEIALLWKFMRSALQTRLLESK